MGELRRIKDAIRPSDTLLVVDAMVGQEAANLVKSFNDQVLGMQGGGGRPGGGKPRKGIQLPGARGGRVHVGACNYQVHVGAGCMWGQGVKKGSPVKSQTLDPGPRPSLKS